MTDIVNIGKSERWISSKRVPRQEVIKIFASDPRNNYEFLSNNPNTIVLDDPVPNVDDSEDYSSEDFIYAELDDSYAIKPEKDKQVELPSFVPPINLEISNFELKKTAADGTVSYTANLSFDDVDSAVSYIYTLNEVR